MSKLERLLGKSQKFIIGGVELDLKPMKVKNLDLIVKTSDKTQQAQAMQEMIKITLKDSVPDATDEEIDNISFEHTMPLMEAIIKVNGLEEMVDKKKVMGNLSSTSETPAK